MRKLTGERHGLWGSVLGAALLAALAGVGPAWAQEGPANPPAQPPKGEEKPKEPSLEDLLAEALKNNPDIRVSEARLRQTEAELNRTRLQVMQKVATLHTSLKAARANVTLAEQRLAQTRQLARTGQAPQTELSSAEASLLTARAELEMQQAQLPVLLGRPPQKASLLSAPESPETTLESEQLRSLGYSFLELGYRERRSPALAVVPGTVAEKLRKALDTPVTAEYKDRPFTDILQDLQKKVPGLTIRNVVSERYKDANPNLTLEIKDPLPLRAVLQALQDEFPPTNYVGSIRFVVREYGLLVAPSGMLPAGAVSLHEFGEAPSDVSTADNPPANEVEGVVRTVDNQSGLVTVSLGSDAGIAKGHTLEVYRLNPPKYLGTIRIIEVQPAESVGKPQSKEPLRPGDHVASHVGSHVRKH